MDIKSSLKLKRLERLQKKLAGKPPSHFYRIKLQKNGECISQNCSEIKPGHTSLIQLPVFPTPFFYLEVEPI